MHFYVVCLYYVTTCAVCRCEPTCNEMSMSALLASIYWTLSYVSSNVTFCIHWTEWFMLSVGGFDVSILTSITLLILLWASHIVGGGDSWKIPISEMPSFCDSEAVCLPLEAYPVNFNVSFCSRLLTGCSCIGDTLTAGTNAQQLHGDRSLGQEDIGSQWSGP